MTIDNRNLTPVYRSDDFVSLEDGSPDWIKELIINEVHIRRLTEEGTFASAVKKLDHFAEAGVNCLWVTPVNDRGTVGNGYGNLGPDTIDPRLTGEIDYSEPWRTSDYEKGWKEFKRFVDAAHKKNIRILLDIVTWGAEDGCPLFKTHPEWFVEGVRGIITEKSRYYNWADMNFNEWFIQQVVNVVLKTGIDGLRFDMEPMYASYRVCKEIRRRVYNSGRKIAVISESTNERLDTFDFEQFGVCDRRTSVTAPQRLFVDDDIVDSFNNGCVPNNIVDCIKHGHGIGSPHLQWAHNGGTFRYYTSMVCCHDYHAPNVRGNRLVIGYQAIFAPFIPLWFVGEEWNNPDITGENECIYYNKIRWDLLDCGEHKELFEDVKKMIEIRRSYPDIFQHFAKQTRNSNICKVNLSGPETIQAYARFSIDRAVLIVPNRTKDKSFAEFDVEIPFESMGIKKSDYTVTDLLTGETVSCSGNGHFKSGVAYENMGVYLVD